MAPKKIFNVAHKESNHPTCAHRYHFGGQKNMCELLERECNFINWSEKKCCIPIQVYKYLGCLNHD